MAQLKNDVRFLHNRCENIEHSQITTEGVTLRAIIERVFVDDIEPMIHEEEQDREEKKLHCERPYKENGIFAQTLHSRHESFL